MLAGGWDDNPPGPAPGFPRDGTWTVRAAGINRQSSFLAAEGA